MIRGEAARRSGAPLRVFDWDKAATLIREHQPTVVGAGLKSDWDWTGGTIFEHGKPVTESYTYLASLWAAPELTLDDVTVECWRLASETPGWDAHTKWPESALAILRADAPASPTSNFYVAPGEGLGATELDRHRVGQ
jgi:hypothetical protein